MKYAIVESGGKQFRAVEGGTLEVDRLPIESGANVKLEQVLLLADGENITVGTPLVKNIPVWTTVVEHFKGPKVNIFNYSPKKRIRVKIGHRQNYTRLFVEQIGGSELVKKEPVKVEKAVEVKAEETAPKAKPEKAKKPVKAEPKAETASPKKTASPKGKKPAAKSPAKTKTKSSPKKTTAAKAEPTSSPKGKAASKKPAAK
ncbi:MAG: 50S ribosomal protein L21 [Chloroflexi bacterium]|nr:50S ribosomal protein L21 [Chloroflexota bacterium]